MLNNLGCSDNALAQALLPGSAERRQPIQTIRHGPGALVAVQVPFLGCYQRGFFYMGFDVDKCAFSHNLQSGERIDGGLHKARLKGCVKKHNVIGRSGLLDGVLGGARDAVAAVSCAQSTQMLAYLM